MRFFHRRPVVTIHRDTGMIEFPPNADVRYVGVFRDLGQGGTFSAQDLPIKPAKDPEAVLRPSTSLIEHQAPATLKELCATTELVIPFLKVYTGEALEILLENAIENDLKNEPNIMEAKFAEDGTLNVRKSSVAEMVNIEIVKAKQ